MRLKCVPVVAIGCAAMIVSTAIAQSGSTVPVLQQIGVSDATFINWENPHVHPLDMTPDGTRLLAVNTADNRLEVFDLTSGTPTSAGSVPVGLDPVSVRAFDNTFAVVVNHISDSLSVVNLTTMNTVITVSTADEPADVVFAGSPQRMYVSCAQANLVQVFDLGNLSAPIATIPLEAQDPRSMAVSPDGLTVYVAAFEGGNRTTILGGGGTGTLGFPPNVVNDPAGPWGGLNPPPNDGAAFSPPQKAGNPPAIAVGMIVREVGGQWLDDNGGDWTSLVSGPSASASGRLPGWTLLDHDIAVIDTATLAVTYQGDLNNINMAMGVNPATGVVSVVGSEAFNDMRFEPIINGRFIQINLGMWNPAGGSSTVADLNAHLAGMYPTQTSKNPNFVALPQASRDLAISDPRGVAWLGDGSKAFITGMGTNNLVVVDSAGARAGIAQTIEVGRGPTGIVLDEARGQAYVQNKFEGSLSVVSLTTEVETDRVVYYDPTPDSITVGRKHLYDSHKNSGLGQASCASCHVDSRLDRLSWDLGNPAGDVKAFNQNCQTGCQDWHPMKGPMTTQTLQAIIGMEPHHWRGDKNGIEDFNGAFIGLLGDDTNLTPVEMQEFENMLETIHFPPNPNRNLDNTLPTSLDMSGHFTTGRFAPAGQPLPIGDAVAGLNAYRLAGLDGVQCVTCHTLPTGAGADGVVTIGGFQPLPLGPLGEHHLSLVSVDGSTNVSMKIPQLRNMHEKDGFNTTRIRNTAGFGFLHDGSVDSIERFVGEPVFSLAGLQMLSDVTAFMLSFGGSDLPDGSPTNFLEPPGPPSLDTHAAVGTQVTFDGSQTAVDDALLAELLTLADTNAIGVVAHGLIAGSQRGLFYAGLGTFQSDIAAETFSTLGLTSLASPGSELTFTAVPIGSEIRIGVDQDDDTFFNTDELLACADPADPFSTPNNSSCCIADVTTTNTNPGDPGRGVPDGVVNGADLSFYVEIWLAGNPAADTTTTNTNPGDPNYGLPDGVVNGADLSFFVEAWLAGCP